MSFYQFPKWSAYAYYATQITRYHSPRRTANIFLLCKSFPKQVHHSFLVLVEKSLKFTAMTSLSADIPLAMRGPNYYGTDRFHTAGVDNSAFPSITILRWCLDWHFLGAAAVKGGICCFNKRDLWTACELDACLRTRRFCTATFCQMEKLLICQAKEAKFWQMDIFPEKAWNSSKEEAAISLTRNLGLHSSNWHW